MPRRRMQNPFNHVCTHPASVVADFQNKHRLCSSPVRLDTAGNLQTAVRLFVVEGMNECILNDGLNQQAEYVAVHHLFRNIDFSGE
ncbi:hypothetical protein D3C80_1899920 [compost metagenome]